MKRYFVFSLLGVFLLGSSMSAFAEESMVRIPKEGDSFDGYFPCKIADEKCHLEKAEKNRMKIKAFYIDKYEVSVGEFKVCVNSGKCEDASLGRDFQDKDDNEVYLSQYDDAVKYCQSLGKRLAKPEEWLSAAVGQKLERYPWGMQYDESMCGGNEEKVLVGNNPRDVSVYGVFDMGCRSTEWVDGERLEGKSPEGAACAVSPSRSCMGHAPYAIYEQFGCSLYGSWGASIRCVKDIE